MLAWHTSIKLQECDTEAGCWPHRKKLSLIVCTSTVHTCRTVQSSILQSKRSCFLDITSRAHTQLSSDRRDTNLGMWIWVGLASKNNTIPTSHSTCCPNINQAERTLRCYCTCSVLRYCLRSLRLTSRVLPNIIQYEGYPKHWRGRFTPLNRRSQKPWFKQIGSTFSRPQVPVGHHCSKSLRII